MTLKAALTLDGRLATRSGNSQWISSADSRRRVHEMRRWSDAVLVGVGTVLSDDPRLDVRHVTGRDPIRVILDRSLRTPESAAVFASGESSVLIFHERMQLTNRQALSEAGAELCDCKVRWRSGAGLERTCRAGSRMW